jgi:hypothetical protein
MYQNKWTRCNSHLVIEQAANDGGQKSNVVKLDRERFRQNPDGKVLHGGVAPVDLPETMEHLLHRRAAQRLDDQRFDLRHPTKEEISRRKNRNEILKKMKAGEFFELFFDEEERNARDFFISTDPQK